MGLLFVKGAETGEPGRRTADRHGVDGVARRRRDAAHGFGCIGLFADEFDDLVDPRTDRPVLECAEDRDLVGPLLGAQRRCLLRLETLDTFLRAPEPIDRPLQPCLGCTS